MDTRWWVRNGFWVFALKWMACWWTHGPAEWLTKVRRQFRGATYHIHVTNPSNVCKGVVEMKVNGDLILAHAASIYLCEHTIEVISVNKEKRRHAPFIAFGFLVSLYFGCITWLITSLVRWQRPQIGSG
ncbi:hypothetical protein O9993_16155 [Vibrio lentus]|nr:hypothetical protein [Vibrio lentus]